ncbi:MAG: hypothetical protein O7C75_01410, partial [Verrucomicrobia bacterium]|nr:hypothetical protein [Verrucomicrobiota bacterium]
KSKGPVLVIVTAALVIGLAGWAVALFVVMPEEKSEVAAAPVAAAPVAALPVAASPVIAAETQETPLATVVSNESETVAEVTVPTAPIVEAPVETVAQQKAVVAQETTTVAPAPEKVDQPRTVAVPPPAAPEVSQPTVKLVLSDEIVYKLKRMEITAIMGDGKNARIMMGGQIHNVGELVDFGLKIRFAGKKGLLLFFTDEHGQVYKKKI